MRTLIIAVAGSLTFAHAASATLAYQSLTGSEVIVAADDGSGAHVIAHGANPSVSPDGRFVAFVAADRRRVLMMSVAGGSPVVVARGSEDALGDGFVRTVWSADSRRVATTEVGHRLTVYDRRTRRSRTGWRFRSGEGARPAFSPSGRRVAFVELPVDGGVVRWIATADPKRGRRLTSAGDWPVWGARGLAYQPIYGERYNPLAAPVFLSDATGRHVRRLAGSTDCRPIAWTGAARLLAACSAGGPVQPTLLRLNGRAPTRLAGSYFGSIDAVSDDHTAALAEESGAIVRGDLRTGARQVLAPAGKLASWSG